MRPEAEINALNRCSDFQKGVVSLDMKKYSYWDELSDIYYTWDPDSVHIEEYLKIRQDTYAQYLGLESYPYIEDVDSRSRSLLAVKSGHCIGGVRITVGNDIKPALLPLEDKRFKLRNLLPEIDFDSCNYAEASRLAFLPEYRTGRQTTALFNEVIKKCKELNVEYLFATTRKTHAMRYRIICKYLGGIKYDFREDIDVPDKEVYGGVRMYLSIMSFNENIKPLT